MIYFQRFLSLPLLHADASVLEIPGDETFLFYPEKSPISLSAVKKAKGENRVILLESIRR